MAKNYHQWNDQTRLKYDIGARKAYDKESMAIGKYHHTAPGYNWCEHQNNYAEKMNEPMHQQKQHRSACNVDKESELMFSELTDKRYIHQLQPRPYTGSFMGNAPSIDNKNLESELIMGLTTRQDRACNPLSGVSIDRFECLPEYGNPQRVKHIVEPWIRGGDNTRDYVRRINYEAQLQNKKTSDIINR